MFNAAAEKKSEELDTRKLVKYLKMRLEYMKEDREEWFELCKEISNVCMPDRGHFYTHKKRDPKKMGHNTYTKRALEKLAAILVAGLTSPTRVWFKQSLSGYTSAEPGSVKIWLGNVQQLMHAHLKDSTFYSECYNLYKDIISYGTLLMAVIPDTRNGRAGLPFYKSFQVGEYFLDMNEFNEIDTVYRIVWLSAADIEERWEVSKLPPRTGVTAIQEALRNDKGYQRFRLIHSVEPRRYRDSSKINSKNKPYASYWWIESDDQLLSESGFDDFPYIVARWNANNNSPYGTGIGFDVLKEANGLNFFEKIVAYAVGKAANPPVVVPARMYDINNDMGGLNYYEGDYRTYQAYPLQPQPNDLASGSVYIQRLEGLIQLLTMNDLLISMLNNPYATATEVVERNEEKMLMLAPPLERIETEALTPLLDRAFSMLYKNKALPKAPPELVGEDIRPVFIGLLAQAQRLTAQQAINTIFNATIAIQPLYPEIVDKVDFEHGLEIIADIVGDEGGTLRPDEEVNKIREQRAQAQAEAQAQMQQQQNIEQMNQLSQIDRNLAASQQQAVN